MTNHHIVMGDIVKSRLLSTKEVHTPFGEMILKCNQKFTKDILSPYTITLGDEFQGVADSIESAVESIIFLEEECIRQHLKFKLRFIVLYGEISTPINRESAYGMLGKGLTEARNKLNKGKNDNHRFLFHLLSPVRINAFASNTILSCLWLCHCNIISAYVKGKG